jgi:hypothetical protein
MTRRSSFFAFLVTSALVGSVAGSAGAAPADRCIEASERGQTSRASGRLRAARKDLLACQEPECPALIRQDCVKWTAEVAAAMPTVIFRVRDLEGHDVMDATVRASDEVVVARIDGRGHELDPGAYDFEIAARGFVTAHERVVVEEGVRGRVVEVHLTRASGASGASGTRAATPPTSDRTSHSPTTLTWAGTAVLGGLGLAAIGTFAVIGLGADADFRHDRDTCGSRCPQDQVDDLHRRYQIADIALAAGVVFVAGSVLFYALGPRTTSTPASTTGRHPTPNVATSALGTFRF